MASSPLHAGLCGKSPQTIPPPKTHYPTTCLFPSTPIKFRAKKQYATLNSTFPPLNKADKSFIQQVCGKFLFLGRTVDPTLLCPISTIASQSAQPTEDTMKQPTP
eukprot:CCRYP_014886-RA/>CCRYP_014886-RA protein AED:0.46 eAED:0.46 QI:0/-1/0/1/-1/0/1/0/104